MMCYYLNTHFQGQKVNFTSQGKSNKVNSLSSTPRPPPTRYPEEQLVYSTHQNCIKESSLYTDTKSVNQI